MDTQASFGGLIPLWILGAPLVWMLIASFGGQKATSRRGTETHPGYPAPLTTRDAVMP